MKAWKSLLVCAVSVVLMDLAQGYGQQVVSASDFYALAEADRHDLLLKALRERIKRLQNIHVSYTLEFGTAKYHNQTLGETTHSGFKEEIESRRIGDSYKFVCRQLPGQGQQPLFESCTGYDATSGVSTKFVDHRDMKDNYGRIDRRHNTILREDYYRRFLDGFVYPPAPFVDYILAYADKLTFEENPTTDGQIIARLEFSAPADQSLEVRRHWIDPAKGFLITKVERRFKRNNKTSGEADFTDQDVFVDESQAVDGVYLPVSALFATRIQTMPEDEVGFVKLRVQKVEIGRLTADDLKVVYPEGTRVSDMVRRVSYVAGREDITTPFPEERLRQGAQSRGGQRRWLVIGSLLVMIGVLAVALGVRYRARRAT